jgi:hypothetical protein
MNTEQTLEAYGASVTAVGGALQIAGMVNGYREARTYYDYDLTEATTQWLREFGHEITCRYCGGTSTEAELTQYCTECVDAHESRACDTAGYCEICDTVNTEPDGYLCVDCMFRSEGVHEDDAPLRNEKGHLFMGNLTGYRATIVYGADLDFSDIPCTGCTGALAGYRYAVTLTERTTQ